LLLATSLTATASTETAAPQWSVLRTTSDQVVLQVELPPVHLNTAGVGPLADFGTIEADFGALTQRVGAPLLPLAVHGVVLPDGATGAHLRAVEVLAEESLHSSLPLLPRAADAEKRPGLARPLPNPDPAIYDAGEWWPRTEGGVSPAFILRGTPLAWVRVAAVRYNPASGEIRAARRLRLEIEFETKEESGGTARADLDARLRRTANPFGDLLSACTIDPWADTAPNNGATAADWPQPDPMLYLIIHADEFAPQAETLAAWKARKGFTTVLTPISSIGASAEAIEEYVDAAYDTWPVPPAYLLLLGDTNTIPADRGDTGWLLKHFTDLHYACVDGNDWVPDLAYGRFPVRTGDQAWHMVQSVIAYERMLMPTTDWLEGSVFIGGEDPNYWDVAEATHRYVISTHIVPSGMDYTVVRGHFGGNTQDITAAINAGTTVANYSGHGGPGSWADPAFSQNNIRNLHNETMLPFVISNACDTGKYAKAECFGETWVRGEGNGGGAIAFYGASNSSYWDGDDYLERDLFDLAFDTSFTTLGEMTIGAQILVDRSGYGRSHYYYEIYNLMGDPALDLWFGQPEQSSVLHPDHYTPGHNQLTITVETAGGGVDDALVALYRKPDLLAVGRTQGGSVTLSFDATAGDDILLTVTGSALAPYEGQLTLE
jgi:gingipain R